MSELTHHSFRALGCANSLALVTPSQSEGSAIAGAVVREIKRIESKFSRYTESGIVSTINNAAGGAPVTVDDETAGLIDYAYACHEQSNGLFDITSGALRRVWDFKSGCVPAQSRIESILPLIGLQFATWSRPHFSLLKQGMEIDFGGFGKEYAVDRAAALALSLGATGGFINLGGDIRVIGAKPGGTPWAIGVQHPREVRGTVAQVLLTKGALTTSGDYERFMVVEGVRYSHIMNPMTGWPVLGFQSVSVCGESCVVAGSVATIAMLLGENDGLAYLNEVGLPFLAVTSESSFTNSSQFRLQTTGSRSVPL